MREIKFRCWNIKEKKWQPYQEWGRAEADATASTQGHYELFSNDYFTWSQYIGFNDKNGKEIYEGDILYVQWPEENEGWDKVEVVWWDAGFRLIYDNGAYDIHNDLFPKDARVSDIWDDPEEIVTEVIGNIYENPELLETSNG